MSTLTEILPARKSSRHSAINWRRAEDNDAAPVAGVLTIHTDRATTNYLVSEFPTRWTNRGFVVGKLVGGTAEGDVVENYTVYCHADRTAAASCDCKGHRRHDTCKHADAVGALLANGWL